MKVKLLFDLRQIDPDDIKDNLCILMDSGYTPRMESTLADFAGKIVEIVFRERKKE